jgi:uncharacterized coiled-coil DUF342 family protein
MSDTKPLTKERVKSMLEEIRDVSTSYEEVTMKKTDKERLDEALMLMDKMKETLSAAWRFINRVYEDGEELADKVNDVIETYEYTTTKWEDEDEDGKD